jgi:medium-chain acyl-[acyl-carrier-protein] hydrolase
LTPAVDALKGASAEPLARIRCLKPQPGAEVQLLCLPYAGGGTWIFKGWARKLPSWLELWVAELAGRDSLARQPPSTRLDDYVAALSRALARADERPVVLFGHSMGALLAFELARALRRLRAVFPLTLCLSGHRAAHLPSPHRPIHLLPQASFIAELSALQGTPDAVLADVDLTDYFVSLLRADFATCETYRYMPEPPLDCGIIALGAVDDPTTSVEELGAWRVLTRGRFRMRLFRGGHFFVNTSQDGVVTALAEELSEPADRPLPS